MREGDIILSVDNVEVSTVKQFQAQVAKADKGKAPINLVVKRDDMVSFVLIKPAGDPGPPSLGAIQRWLVGHTGLRNPKPVPAGRPKPGRR